MPKSQPLRDQVIAMLFFEWGFSVEEISKRSGITKKEVERVVRRVSQGKVKPYRFT